MEHYLVRSSKVAPKLYLNEITLEQKVEPTEVHAGTNHVFCCDVSGSMYRELSKMRSQLKSRIPDIVHPEDTITIIAFSGHNECTVLKELVNVGNLTDLKALNDAIDRFLVPVGCTCFLDPVEYTHKLINETNSDKLWSFIFLSDGGNNDCPWSNVVAELNSMQDKIDMATIIEYGYYADSQKLTEMAETLGGAKIVADDFDSYVPKFESIFTGKSVKKVEVDISELKSKLKYQQFILLDYQLKQVKVVSSANRSSILVPEDTTKIYCLSESKLGSILNIEGEHMVAYAMAYVCADSLRYDVVEHLLSFIGDTKFIQMYCNSYGKQKLFDFQNELLQATFDPSLRGEIDTNYKPNDKAFCVVDLLELLMNGDNSVYVASPRFNYNRIGAKSVVKQTLSEDQANRLAKANSKLKVDKIKKELDEQSVKLDLVDKGYPINNFTWNEDRANLSAQIKIDANLTLPKNKFGLKSISSFVFRNYAIIKDGVINVTSLPVALDSDTRSKIMHCAPHILSENLGIDDKGRCICDIDLSTLPVVNKKRISSVKCSKMTSLAYNLTELKFKLKYLGYLKKKFNVSDRIEAGSGSYYVIPAEQVEYLSSLGITSKNGYSPNTEQDKTGDFYMALTLKSQFKGFSSVPKIEDIDKKLSSGKSLTPAETFMKNIMNFVDSKYLDVKGEPQYKEAIRSAFNQLTIEKRTTMEDLAKMKFGLILSRKWFSDRKGGFEDNHDEIKNSFGDVMTIDYKFTETKANL